MSTNGNYFAGQQPPYSQPGSQPVGLSINNTTTNNTNNNSNYLSSNNPFRNRATSPAAVDNSLALSTSPFDDPPQPRRPVSRNPFLEHQTPLPANFRPADPTPNRSNTHSLTAEDIFGSLTLDEKSKKNNQLIDFDSTSSPPQIRPTPHRGGENQPPPRPANNKHRPTPSQEEALRARKPSFTNSTSKATLAIDPSHRKPQRRPRRNSDSSLMDFDNRRFSDDDKTMTGDKRSERDWRRRDGKEKSKAGRPSRKMDIIDQLDATGICGTGVFHHDGPFDALNPHRNRQSSRRLAPMQAFPKDSLNNTLGGAGPLNPRADHSQFMGHGDTEAFNDFATSGKKASYGYSSSRETTIFDPASRGTMVHGDESYGLGTSTFLEGTPAARSAIVRREAEYQQEVAQGGLQRKKSLAQRIRQINRGPRDHNNPSGRSVDQSRFGTSLGSEGGPYSSESNQADESVNIKKSRDGKPSTPPVPRPRSGDMTEQQETSDAAPTASGEVLAKPSGLLGRMKSLKGGRRPTRNETP